MEPRLLRDSTPSKGAADTAGSWRQGRQWTGSAGTVYHGSGGARQAERAYLAASEDWPVGSSTAGAAEAGRSRRNPRARRPTATTEGDCVEQLGSTPATRRPTTPATTTGSLGEW